MAFKELAFCKWEMTRRANYISNGTGQSGSARKYIQREPWKLGQPHEPMSWREETDGNLREGKVKVERRRSLKLSYLSCVFMWGRKGRRTCVGKQSTVV